VKREGEAATVLDPLALGPRLDRICLRNLLASTTEAIYFKDRRSRFLLVSRGVVQHHLEHDDRHGAQGSRDMTPDDFVGKTDRDLFDGPVAEAWIEEEQEIMSTGQPIVDILERDTSSDSTVGWFRTSKAPLCDEEGNVIGLFGISRDVTAQVLAEQELLHREAQLRAVLDSSPDAIAFYSRKLRYEMVNTQTVALLGASPSEVIGKTDAELGRPPEVVGPLTKGLRRAIDSKAMSEVEYSTHLNGATSWWHVRMVPHLDSDGLVSGVVAATRDLSELKAAESLLAHQALHDPLTGLANRLALTNRIDVALSQLQEHTGRVALLFVDLDNFKLVNDSKGHEVGDQLLVQVASRLTQATRRADTVARLGGDEFVVLIGPLPASDNAQPLVARMLRSLRKPYRYGGGELTLTASIGATITSDPNATATDLLREADEAMYRAKEKGRDRAEFSRPLRLQNDQELGRPAAGRGGVEP
jgi:diguanylate cyclase (GGDEF)-like protein/PAS domain S-box-containing protein